MVTILLYPWSITFQHPFSNSVDAMQQNVHQSGLILLPRAVEAIKSAVASPCKKIQQTFMTSLVCNYLQAATLRT